MTYQMMEALGLCLTPILGITLVFGCMFVQEYIRNMIAKRNNDKDPLIKIVK